MNGIQPCFRISQNIQLKAHLKSFIPLYEANGQASLHTNRKSWHYQSYHNTSKKNDAPKLRAYLIREYPMPTTGALGFLL